MAANTANIKAVITAEDKASPALKKFGSNVSGLGSTIAGVFAGAAIVKFGTDSVKAFEDSETAVAQLNAVLKSTGGIAGVTAKDALALSKQIQRTTSVSDEAALSVENMALTFTNIKKDVFPEFTKTAIDVATALNHGMKPSTEQLVDVTKQLGKAMQDPDGSIGALHRMGVNTDELKLKLEKVNDPIEKQKLILQELAKEMGGSATEQAKTFGGQVDQMKNQFNDLQEQIGQTISKALLPILDYMADHPGTVKALTYALMGLAAAFVAVKVAMLMQSAFALFQGGMAVAQASAIGLNSTLTFIAGSAGGFALIGAAAVVAAALVANKLKQTMDTVNNTKNAIASLQTSTDVVTARMNKLYETGKLSIEKLYQLQQAGVVNDNQNKIYNNNNTYVPSYASGTDNHPGGMAWVGEQGKELVTLPKGSQVTPNDRLGNGQTINITVQAGAFMGSQQDARKYAQMISEALKDVASSKNTSVGSLLGI